MKKLIKITISIIVLTSISLSLFIFASKTIEFNIDYSENASPISYPVISFAKSEIPRSYATLLFFGDTILLDPLDKLILEDPDYTPFESVLETFKKYDYVIGNQEGTIDGAAVGSPNAGKPYTFTSPKESVDVYKKSGIDAFSYANNHAKDYGPNSVLHTMELLRSQGIDVFGAGANKAEAFTPLIKEIKGIRIAFLGFNCAEYAFNIAYENEPGTASYSEYYVRESIGKAKANADVVVVIAHCGTENDVKPDAMQIEWAKIFTSAGADIVIGGHPHVRQAPAIVNDKIVIYSIGNFMIPGQSTTEEKKSGWMVELIISNKKIDSYKLIDIKMDDWGRPILQ